MRDLSPAQELDRIRRELAQDRTDIQRLWRAANWQAETSQQPPWDLGGQVSFCPYCASMGETLTLTVTKISGPWIVAEYDQLVINSPITLLPPRLGNSNYMVWPSPCYGPLTSSRYYRFHMACSQTVGLVGTRIGFSTNSTFSVCPPENTVATIRPILTNTGVPSGVTFTCDPFYAQWDEFNDFGSIAFHYRYRFEVTA